MLTFITIKGECTGCTACKAVCPVHCISMVSDDEGFWYPVSSDKCIECKRCEKVCPSHQSDRTANHNEQHAYACLSKDNKIWRRSASGGAFSEICLTWGDKNTIVVGATWDGFKVHHICVEGVQNIALICKSKYIASNLENTFAEIKEYLKVGRKVVFCGVPCQVAGLKSFLGKEFDNLLTIDLICHGAGSPLVFESSIRVMEKQFGGAIEKYEFRAKRRWFETEYLSSIKVGRKTKYIYNDPYMQLFLQQKSLRPSCGENCKYRTRNRQGDLTIADFKGLTEVFPQLKGTKRNYSTIVTNNAKGESVVLKLNKMDIYPCDLSVIGKYNPLFERQTWFAKDRDLFFDEYKQKKEEAIIKWTKPASVFERTLKRRVFDILPVCIRKHLL